MEIEVPRRLMVGVAWAMLIVAPIFIGWMASPVREDGRPLLLTPRLARVNQYRQAVGDWVRAFHMADDELTTLLGEQAGDLLKQNEQVNRAYQRVKLVTDGIDCTPVPPTFEPLHELLTATAMAYLEASVITARWISEPVDENQQAAQKVLSAAGELLERLDINPWIEVKP